MKTIIALLAITLASTAFASENLEFGDLNYYLKQSQFNVKGDIVQSSFDRKIGSTKIETEGFTAKTNYGFGIMDNLNVYLGIDYDVQMRSQQNRKGVVAGAPPAPRADSRWSQDGFKDPSLALNYRLLNQKDAAVNFDIGAMVRYSFEDRTDGAAIDSDTKDGNATSGRTNYEINTAVGRKWNEANEWRIGAGFVHHMSGERTQKIVGAASEDLDLGSSQDFFLRAAYQYRPVQEFMLGFMAAGTRIGERDSEYGALKSESDARMAYDFTFHAKYLLTESFIVKFAANQSLRPDYDVDADAGNYEVKNMRASFYSLGVDFLF